jgi:hypothetical protein
VTTGISSDGWDSPAYDAAGNIVSGPKAGAETPRLHFVYDARNRLVQVQADSGGRPSAHRAEMNSKTRSFQRGSVSCPKSG